MASVTRRCAGGVAASPRSGAAAGGGRRGTGAARAVAASACSFANRLANPSLRALGRRDRRPVAAPHPRRRRRIPAGDGRRRRPVARRLLARSLVPLVAAVVGDAAAVRAVRAGAVLGGGSALRVVVRLFRRRGVVETKRKETEKKSEANVSLVSCVRKRKEKRKIDRPRAPFERSRRPALTVFVRSNVLAREKTGTCHPGTPNRAKGVGLFRSDTPGREPRRPRLERPGRGSSRARRGRTACETSAEPSRFTGSPAARPARGERRGGEQTNGRGREISGMNNPLVEKVEPARAPGERPREHRERCDAQRSRTISHARVGSKSVRSFSGREVERPRQRRWASTSQPRPAGFSAAEENNKTANPRAFTVVTRVP